jgi:dolichol-phosphate mannosyltransferase
MRKIFLIPVYNEEDNIPGLFNGLKDFCGSRGWDYKIYAVNDGSLDGTFEKLKFFQASMPIEIVDMVTNQGPGSAFKRGFKEIIKKEKEGALIITLEADGTSDLGILEDMVSKAEKGVDLVLASCYAEGGGIKGTNIYRKTNSMVANFLIGLVSRRPDIKTYSSFYRVYRYQIVSRLYKLYGESFMEEPGFACAVELFMKLAKLKVSIEEVPIILDCKKRIGSSKMKVLPTTLAYLRILYRHLMRSVSFWMITKKR